MLMPWYWRRLLSMPRTTRRSSQSTLKELWPPDANSELTGKDPDAGKVWGHEEKGETEDEMVGWHHWLKRQEFEQTRGDGEGQGSLASYSPWGSQRAGHDWATEQQLLHAYFASDQSWWLMQPNKADMRSWRCFRPSRAGVLCSYILSV